MELVGVKILLVATGGHRPAILINISDSEGPWPAKRRYPLPQVAQNSTAGQSPKTFPDFNVAWKRSSLALCTAYDPIGMKASAQWMCWSCGSSHRAL